MYLQEFGGARKPTYYIFDGPKRISTGCGEDDRAGAEREFASYLAKKHTPPKKAGRGLSDIAIADVMLAYMREHASQLDTNGRQFVSFTADPILDWWGSKNLSEIKGQSCRDYVKWRTAQPIKISVRQRKDGTYPEIRYTSVSTARHELKTLRAAINHWHREHGPLPSVPAVTMPPPAPPRDRWLTRSEAARLIKAAYRTRQIAHMARFSLVGLYTGTRSGAILGLQWPLSETDIPGRKTELNKKDGWIDLASGILHRKGPDAPRTKKGQPPIKIPSQLLAHLMRWYKADVTDRIAVGKKPLQYLIHYAGKRILKPRRSFDRALVGAGLEDTISPHIIRHTATTWLMQGGCDIYDAAGFLGMSPEVLIEVYGHHHPDYQSGAAEAKRGRKAVPSRPRMKTERGGITN